MCSYYGKAKHLASSGKFYMTIFTVFPTYMTVL